MAKTEYLTITDYKQSDEYKQIAPKIWEAVQKGETVNLSNIYEPSIYRYFSELQKLYTRFFKKEIDQKQAAEEEQKLYKTFCEEYETKLNYLFSQVK